jgi:hypothetical protein
MRQLPSAERGYEMAVFKSFLRRYSLVATA